jgi:hypothetical protein
MEAICYTFFLKFYLRLNRCLFYVGRFDMRDFNVGNNLNIHGDLQINDNSHQSKFFIDCSNNELFEERTHRKKLLIDERKSKWKRYNYRLA